MTWLDLDREYEEWHAGESADAVLVRRSHNRLRWDDIRSRRRVILLADGGSGKSTELRARAAELQRAGFFAVFTSLVEVDRYGTLEAALRPAERQRLDDWRRSEADGWFILDSIDEAKRNAVRFRRVAAIVADSILGHEGRAHVIFTGRPADWETRADLNALIEELPIPVPGSLAPPPSEHELLINIVRRKKPPDPEPNESPLIVIMRPLDAPRIGLYARTSGIKDSEAMVQNIIDRNLEHLAGRPLDLIWMTDFWRSNHRFGTLRDMMHRSLRERVVERVPGAALQDGLSEAKAIDGLERLGAALVFSRKRSIEIPDADPVVDGASDVADFAAILPDWSSADRAALLRRSALEPGSLGTVQIHNDNNGLVRSFLAARWLLRLQRQKNLTNQQISDLLFARRYDLPVVRPSLRETAAWLSIENDAVANELVSREPILFLSMGDPESLPLAVRKKALEAVCAEICTSDKSGLWKLSHDALKRFAQPDLTPTIQALWRKYTSGSVRTLLLELIWLGRLADCFEQVESVITTNEDIPLVQRSIAARAYFASANQKQRETLAGTVRAHPARFHLSVTWELMAGLYPEPFTLNDLIAVVEKLDREGEDFSSEFEGAVPLLVEKMRDASTLNRFLEAMLRILGGKPGDLDGPYDHREETIAEGIAVVAQQLLSVASPSEVPQAAIDAALRLGRTEYRDRDARSNVFRALQSTPERRRLALWRAFEQLQGHPHLHEGKLEFGWQLGVLGYEPGIRQEDVDWLLNDAQARRSDDEKCFALNTALSLWRDAGSPGELIRTIEAVAAGNERLSRVVDEARKPVVPNPELVRMQQRSKDSERRNAAQRAAHDQEWIRFFDDLKANPDQLRNVRPTTAEGADARLFHLWELLRGAFDGNNRHSASSLGSLGELLGPNLSTYFIAGLGKHWRAWHPKLDSQKARDKRNESSALDLMGVAGISLEAAQDPGWAAKLTEDEAKRAAQYATLEINGTPGWLTDLVRVHQSAVRGVYLGELNAELNEGPVDGRYAVLDDLRRASADVQNAISESLLAELIERPELGPEALSPMLEILRGAATRSVSLAEALTRIVRHRFHESPNDVAGAGYLPTLFALDASAATQALVEKLEREQNEEKKIEFLISLLPQIVGGRWHSRATGIPLPFESLLQLVVTSHAVLKPDDDPKHEGVFSPSPHDDAADSRNHALRMLVETPGRATYAALHRLSQDPRFPYPSSRMLELARERAENDSELEPWPLSEPVEFEKSLQFAPATIEGLHEVAVNRLRDIQHDLIHADFAQGSAVRLLPDEKALQNWIADRLKLVSSRTYTVERESHVAGEKEPDVRLRSRQSDASVPIEVKVPESWSYAELKAALITQLCGQYLQHAEARHGILLLVHQDGRARGWRRPGETTALSFTELVADLRIIAAAVCEESPSSPQPSVEVLNVADAP